MSLRRFLRTLGVLALLALGTLSALAIAIALAPFPANDLETAPRRNVQGVFHVHAEGSHDGFGTLEEAAKAAKALGNRFLVLTEHNTLLPERPSLVEGVVIVPGIEISSAHGHVIALGLERHPEERGPEVLAAIARAKGEAILAHPVNRKRPWDDPSPEGFTGFEGISLDSALRTSLAEGWGRIALAGVALLGDSRKAGALLHERPAEALDRYDELTAIRDVAMLCGVDAHGLPPYKTSFAALSLHLELPAVRIAAWGRDPAADAVEVRDAVVEARTFCSVPAWGDAASFRFQALRDEVTVEVAHPTATLVLFRDGEEVARGAGPRLTFPGEPGVWRAEVLVDPGFPYKRDRLWITTSAKRISPGTEQPGR